MRSTKIAPVSLSTSYFTGSESFGISMMTLISSGGFLPGETSSRPMVCSRWGYRRIAHHFMPLPGAVQGRAGPTCAPAPGGANGAGFPDGFHPVPPAGWTSLPRRLAMNWNRLGCCALLLLAPLPALARGAHVNLIDYPSDEAGWDRAF